MAILLNGSTSVSVSEASPGIELGTLSGGNGTYQLYFSDDTYTEIFNTDLSNPQNIIGNTLTLSDDWYLDFETKKFTKFVINHQNGSIVNYTNAYRSFENEGENPTVRIKSGNEDQIFTISIVDKDETVLVTTPTPFVQNRYGEVIAQVSPADNHFSSVYFLGDSFLEISGQNLKLKDSFYYSENGKIMNNAGSSYNTSEPSEFSDLKLIVNSGYTFDNSDNDNNGSPDLGFTTLTVNNYLSTFFGASNINTTPQLTVNPINFTERDFGALVATINYSGSETLTYSFEHSFFEITDGSKIKIKDNYFYDKTTGFILDQDGSGYSVELSNPLKITATKTDTNDKIITETINTSEIQSTIFQNSNVDGTALISVVPVNFYDKELGSVIAKLEYAGDEDVYFTLRSEGNDEHAFFEMSGSNYLKLKNTHYYDHNRKHFTQKDFTNTYKVADQGITYNKLNLLAKEVSSEKNIASELITFQDFASTVFADSNILDKDESYPFVTDLNWVDRYENYPKTGREEYQKNIGEYWVLDENETISFSFLEPGAPYYGSYQELGGIVEPNDAFKEAGRKAFNVISSFSNITFKEITETENVVGDLRIGIVDKDHFGMSLSYAAYSQSVSHSPTGGNIFFNGTMDQNNDGLCDFKQESLMTVNTWNFVTFMHEIIHSLGLKHPFDVFDSTDQEEGQANVVSKQYDQYTHTIMSYSPLRNGDPYNIEYDGITLNGFGSKQYYPATPMLHDVMALQEMYGLNPSNENSDTLYSFTPEAPPFEIIYDTGGNDTLDLSSLSGGSQIDLNENQLSKVGSNYLIPFKTDNSGTSYGTAQGSPFSVIKGTEIEKVLLPSGTSDIKSGNYNTYFVGKENSIINALLDNTEISIKASGLADDTLTLNQTSTHWGADFVAKHVGNNGIGAVDEEIRLSQYLKHDLTIDLGLGTDTIQGTSGNDALFLQNFATNGNTLYNEDTGRSSEFDRIIGVENIYLSEGDNFLDLTSTLSSLSGQDLLISSGSGSDILWLSDADEIVNSGDGNDRIILNGGTDTISTGSGNDVIYLSNNTGNLIISDFDTSTDQFIFSCSSQNISAIGNQIIASNSIGNYTVTLSNYPDLSDLDSFSTFLIT